MTDIKDSSPIKSSYGGISTPTIVQHIWQ